MKLAPLEEKPFPSPIPLIKLIGPSFIILGVGLGSGELILWPYLASNFGLGIIWGAILGISLQFFLNMEIERYTLVRGESVFVGMARKLGIVAPIWFTLSTFIPWIWPGIAASSAVLLSAGLGIKVSPVILLLLLGVLYGLGKVVYKTQETIQKVIILVGVPFVLALTLILAKPMDFEALIQGLIGKGDGYWFLPLGIPIGTFLTAFVYAGAGGNLNLAQSLYAREKGYGMAKYAGKVTNILLTKNRGINLEGSSFRLNPQNLSNFRAWWGRINLEHWSVFWVTGVTTMLMLSLLAYSTVYGSPHVATSINFILEEAKVIATQTSPIIARAFILIGALMLFGTQFSVFGSNARIMGENTVILVGKKLNNLSRLFYFYLFLQVAAGVFIFTLGLREPLTLLVIGGALNAVSMSVYSFLILVLNLSLLERPLRPGILRIIPVVAAGIFYGVFSVLTIFRIVK